MRRGHEDPLWWFEQAECQSRNPLIFTQPVGGRSALAKSICDGCLAQNVCFWFALANETDERSSVYGGFTPEERSFFVDLHFGKMPGRNIEVWRYARDQYEEARDLLWDFLEERAAGPSEPGQPSTGSTATGPDAAGGETSRSRSRETG